jgi:putative membrane protein
MIMKARTIVIAAVAVGAISVAALSVRANDMSAQDFAKKVSVANTFEIDSSRLALEKSTDEDVKSFAQSMIDDHTQAGEDFSEALASSDSKAKAAQALDSKHQKMMNTLQAASGNNFNRQYIAMQTDAHKQAVSLFSDYSRNGKDKALKDFATNTLPTLQEHLQHVQTLK